MRIASRLILIIAAVLIAKWINGGPLGWWLAGLIGLGVAAIHEWLWPHRARIGCLLGGGHKWHSVCVSRGGAREWHCKRCNAFRP